METACISREMLGQMAAFLARHECWATAEETAEWLKTEQGQRIHALIEARRHGAPPAGKKTKKRGPA